MYCYILTFRAFKPNLTLTMKHCIAFLTCVLLVCSAFAQVQKKQATAKPTVAKKAERLVELKTDFGTAVIKLYDSTPLHRDNFVKLVKQGFYDSLLFHRIIQGFMIQGGDPNSKHAEPGAMLGNGEAPGTRIPAEFKPFLIHKKGALAMARDDNPEKASSNCQFYIVQGQVFDDAKLNSILCERIMPSNPSFYYTDAQRKLYKTVGGAPFLDQNYTVFGEVIKGLEVIDKIAALPKDANDRPVTDVRIKMKMLN
jgi:cyclophilin family peptidyl-prolyl cis-trans isomerase